MKHNIYCIFDMVAEEAGPLIDTVNDKVAARSAQHALKNADPRDFRLYRVGTYDTVKCTITSHDPVEISIHKEEEE